MIIKRIELVNYCQHEHRSIDISGNLIAVVGHNGVGKSNFLGAIQFALTGEQPGKTKDSLLHWGAKEGHVTLDFVQDGKPGHLERSVNGPKVTLEYDGVTTSGITNVAKELETRLHIDKDLVKQSVFVRQTEIDTIISAKTDKRDREVAFQKLLGLDAAKIHKNLTDWMYAATKPVNYDIQLTEAEQRLGATEVRKAELAQKVEQAERALAESGDDTADEGPYQAISLITAVLQAKAEVETTAKASADWTQTLANVTADAAGGENPGVDLVTKAEEISVLKDELRKAQAYANAKQILSRAEADLAALRDKPHPSTEEVEAALKAHKDKEAEISVARHEVNTRKKAVESIAGGESICPVCGKPLDADAAVRLRTELDACTERLSRLSDELVTLGQVYDAKHADRQLWEQQSVVKAEARLQASVALNLLEVPSLDAQTAETELQKDQKQWLDQKTYDGRVAKHKQAIADAELKLKVAQTAAAEAVQRYEDVTSKAVELCGPDAAADWEAALTSARALTSAAEARRRKIGELKVSAAQAKAAYQEVDKALATLTESVASLKAEQAKQDILAKKLGVLERVRDWFHYANGPRILVTQVLAALTDDVNRFLGNFTAPFVVLPDSEQLGFKVEFTDGRTRPEEPPGTDVLSGGERVQLAVAFRLAIYAMFAGKLGLLSLDEPTAYLDDGNVDRFGVLLTKVKELARNMNTQVFMATHERAVIPHMDSIIDLN